MAANRGALDVHVIAGTHVTVEEGKRTSCSARRRPHQPYSAAAATARRPGRIAVTVHLPVGIGVVTALRGHRITAGARPVVVGRRVVAAHDGAPETLLGPDRPSWVEMDLLLLGRG